MKQDDIIDSIGVTALWAEGARIGLGACRICGAAILIDPRDPVDRPKQHAEWHSALEESDG